MWCLPQGIYKVKIPTLPVRQIHWGKSHQVREIQGHLLLLWRSLSTPHLILGEHYTCLPCFYTLPACAISSVGHRSPGQTCLIWSDRPTALISAVEYEEKQIGAQWCGRHYRATTGNVYRWLDKLWIDKIMMALVYKVIYLYNMKISLYKQRGISCI